MAKGRWTSALCLYSVVSALLIVKAKQVIDRDFACGKADTYLYLYRIVCVCVCYAFNLPFSGGEFNTPQSGLHHRDHCSTYTVRSSAVYAHTTSTMINQAVHDWATLVMNASQ